MSSSPLHEPVQNLFLSGLFELYVELIAFRRCDCAVAEFLVEYAFAGFEGCAFVFGRFAPSGAFYGFGF